MRLQENASFLYVLNPSKLQHPELNPLCPEILHRQKGPAASDNVLPPRDQAWAASWATGTLQESAAVEVLVLTL